MYLKTSHKIYILKTRDHWQMTAQHLETLQEPYMSANLMKATINFKVKVTASRIHIPGEWEIFNRLNVT